MDSKKILITGCAWFIGSNIVEKLLHLDYIVVGLDNLEYGYHKNIAEFELHPNFTFVKWDIRDKEFLEDLFRKEEFTHVCHQAARWSVPKSIVDPILTNEENITGTLNLLWIAHTYHIEKFVCAISSSVYGDTPVLPKVESMPYNPISPYALTKVAKEMYCKLFYETYGLPTVGLRYFNVYGKKQDPQWAYAAVIPRWIKNAHDNIPLELNGDGMQTRDFTYIDDVVDANILALFTENTEAFWKGFNICFGQRTYIRDLAQTILTLTDSHATTQQVEWRRGDIQDSLWDYTLASTLFGYAPKIDMQTGIGKTIAWYRENKDYFLTI